MACELCYNTNKDPTHMVQRLMQIAPFTIHLFFVLLVNKVFCQNVACVCIRFPFLELHNHIWGLFSSIKCEHETETFPPKFQACKIMQKTKPRLPFFNLIFHEFALILLLFHISTYLQLLTALYFNILNFSTHYIQACSKRLSMSFDIINAS